MGITESKILPEFTVKSIITFNDGTEPDMAENV